MYYDRSCQAWDRNLIDKRSRQCQKSTRCMGRDKLMLKLCCFNSSHLLLCTSGYCCLIFCDQLSGCKISTVHNCCRCSNHRGSWGRWVWGYLHSAEVGRWGSTSNRFWGSFQERSKCRESGRGRKSKLMGIEGRLWWGSRNIHSLEHTSKNYCWVVWNQWYRCRIGNSLNYCRCSNHTDKGRKSDCFCWRRSRAGRLYNRNYLLSGSSQQSKQCRMRCLGRLSSQLHTENRQLMRSRRNTLQGEHILMLSYPLFWSHEWSCRIDKYRLEYMCSNHRDIVSTGLS